MLQPKRTKYRKVMKGRNDGLSWSGAAVSFGEYGLKATQHGQLTARQIEAARRSISRYVKRGEVLGYLVAGPSDRVRTAITQEDMDLIRSRLQGVQVRLANSPESILNGNLKRQVPGGEFDLVSPALGSSGGGEIAVDPTKEGGKHSLKRVFDMEISLDKASPGSVFGDRAFVRFDLGAAPLGWQWFVRLRQVFLSQLSV